MTLAAGIRLGPYEIVAPLGAGGMGEVYRARDTRLQREVAVKVLPDGLARDSERRARFESEARALAALSQPNLVAIHDVGVQDETYYAVMELLDGETLRRMLDDGPLPVARAISFAIQISMGLAAAHDHGIVHRDLKPENVIALKDGRIKVLDFGLAKRSSEGGGSDLTSAPTVANATEPGMVLGTVGYMSPEQVRGLPADPRSDLFALGALVYEMVSGRRAFRGESPADTMTAILREEPPDLTQLEREIPPGLERIIRRCLEKQPEARFRSAHDLAYALEAITASGRVEAASGSHRGTSSRVGGPIIRRLTFRNGSIGGAFFTPDGHGVVYGAAWEGKPFEVFTSRLGSPESRSLGLPAGDLLAMSEAGEMALSLGHHHFLWNQVKGTLARASLAGGGVRLLQQDVAQADWAPGGKTMAVVRYAGGRCRLEYPAGHVVHETADWLSRPRVSPDGKRVAYAEHSVRGDSGGQVWVVDDSGSPRPFGDWVASLSGIAWSRSGDEVWCSGIGDDLSNGVWALPVAGGRRTVYTSPARVRLHDIAADGRVLLSVGTLREGIYFGAGGELESDLSWFDGSIVSDISSDGMQVLFLEALEAENPRYATFLRAVDGAPAVRLGEGYSTRLSPDGAWALTIAMHPASDLVLCPTGLGETRSLRSPEIQRYHWAGWHPDGAQIYVVGSDHERRGRLYLQPAAGGSPRRVWDEEIVGDLILGLPISADGDRLVFRRTDGSAVLLAVGSGRAEPLPAIGPEDTPIRFDQTGGQLFVAVREGDGLSVERLDLETGERRPWLALRPPNRVGIIYISPPVLNPAGDRYAYSYTRSLSDLFVVEGLG